MTRWFNSYPELVLDIRDQCHAARVAFFFKQWGGPNKKKTGRLLQGRTHDQLPNVPSTPIKVEAA